MKEPITITIERKTWKSLAQFRIDYDQKTFDDVIRMLLKEAKP